MGFGNNVTIVGNVTRDPELRFTPNGAATSRIGVAVNRKYKDRTGDMVEQTSFFDVVCWGDLAENVSTSIKKGTRVLVSGELRQNTWEKDGDKRSAIEIIAEDVAPSLRWATATVEKTQRRAPGEGGGEGGGGGYGRPVPN
ncbi:MAG: single-stranded DNA-binding protein, partial [Acidimicrobiia bacterium]